MEKVSLTFWIEKVKIEIKKYNQVLVHKNKDDLSESYLVEVFKITKDEITLSDKTRWSIDEFKDSIQNNEIELICDCFSVLEPVPIFSTFYLGCKKCKD